MTVKLAFAAVLFCVVFSNFGSSQDIPDDVVYTEVKKTLVNGTKGILRCQFKGLPNAVYWKKGFDPVESPSTIIWSYGDKSGPRYEDGSCDIDGNYSLVIRNVRNTDAGRYICRVSNYKGILKYNYTDVMITNSAVRTEQSVAVQMGEVGVVPCQVNIRPRRVSWVRGANDTLVSMDLSRSVVERSGPGYEEGLFNITGEYSLVINDVRILHEDSYFCEVTDFDTGHIFQNVTRLNVFAFPLEPFPSIEECPREQQDLSSCTLRIDSQTTLTCEVKEYYPVIDLFFMHGSLRVDYLETRVWNNSDGTKNKRITVATNDTSDAVYECVARGMVGEAKSRSMTIHMLQNVKQTRVAVAVVIPAILVSTIIVIAVCFTQRRKRHLKRRYAKVSMVYKPKQRDLISYIELWTLARYAREQNLSDKLGRVLETLIKGEESSKTLQTDEDYYKTFCRWKAGYTGTCQRKDFFEACRIAGLESAIDKLQKYSNSPRAVTVDDLEHTLWTIAENDRIIGLLEDLGAPHEHLEMLKGTGKQQVIEGAMNILKYWRDANSSRNQDVMLSLALDTTKYTPSDRDFFRMPEIQKRGLDRNEMQAFLLPQITSRHCTKLINATTDVSKKYETDLNYFDNIIEENRRALFDSPQMIEDWWAEQNCSYFERRCRLWRAAKDTGGRTDDLAIDMSKADEPATHHRDRHCEKPEDTANQGLLSPPKSKLIYKAELVDMALGLIMEDFRPFADSLGIERTKFASYRQEFHASHLEVGTISLVFQLFKKTESVLYKTSIRHEICSILDKAGYPNVSKRFMLASEPSYGELFAIETAVAQEDKAKTTVTKKPAKKSKNENETAGEMEQSPLKDGEKPQISHTGHEETPRSDAALALTSINVEETKSKDDDGEVIKTGGSVIPSKPVSDIENRSKPVKSNTDAYRQRVHDLQKMLELNDEDIPDSNTASVPTLLKIWKERVCPGLIDHRVVLAEGLQRINKPQLVAEVFNGRYQSRETSMDFIEDMLGRMDGPRRTSLEHLLKTKQDKKKWLKSSGMTSQWVYDWVADWTNEMESSVKNKVKDLVSFTQASKRHRDFNDKLVDRGLLDLAREIMNIEQIL